MADKKLSQLLYYGSHGYPIFPVNWMDGEKCSCGNPGCSSPGKHPLVGSGFKVATTDLQQIQEWHDRWPSANWGMRTGSKADGGSGVLVVDLDGKNGGFISWENIEQDHPDARFETVTVKTGSGNGEHLWFHHPDGVDIRSGAGVLGPGVDIRADGGYVLVPPSKTKESYVYRIKIGDADLEEIPDWMLAMLNGRVRTKAPKGKKIPDIVHEGARHDTLVETAGRLRFAGLGADEIRISLMALRDERFSGGDHPVTDAEVNEIVSWTCEKKKDYDLTDIGNGQRFADQHHHEVRWCPNWEKWLVWDGRRWGIDELAALRRRAHVTAKRIYIEASEENDPDRSKALGKHAYRSQSSHKLNSMVNEASPYMVIDHKDLDQHPFLLNVANGTIDLRTGDIRKHDPKDYITKLIDVTYDERAECPEWESFISMVTGGDKELAFFLQKAVGYSLTGSTDEQKLFFLYGTGANGKTTFVETVLRLMTVGEYAVRTDIEALMAKWNTGQANPHIANMAGARFVLASEIPENRKINESLVKDLTGGDSMTARHLFANPFTFSPTHKIMLFGNYKPRATGTDWGFWRRMKVIPFSITIPEETRRPFSEVMNIFDYEIAGILNWAITGCLAWQHEGLGEPTAVNDATNEYRTEQDILQTFLDEMTESHPDHSIAKNLLYRDFRDWCEENGEKTIGNRTKTWFTRQMTKRGYESGGHGNMDLIGIKLK